MKKTAQYPYDQVGLAPGLPQGVEWQHQQRPPQESSLPGWALPVGGAAAGLLGLMLLKKRFGGGKALTEAASGARGASGIKGNISAEGLTAAPGEAGASRLRGKSRITSPASQLDPATQMSPLEYSALGRPEMQSLAYPGKTVGTQSGQIYEQALQANPKLQKGIKQHLQTIAEDRAKRSV